MSRLHASTQYGDSKGTVSITWNAEFRLNALAERIGIPEEEIPIGLRIYRTYGINRSSPEDRRSEMTVSLEVFTLPRANLGEVNVVEYLEATRPQDVQVKAYRKTLENTEEIMIWFKEIDIVALNSNLAGMDLTQIEAEEIETE